MNWRQRARALRRDVYALYFAIRDPRTPWYAKACAGLVVAYAFSPIDLIPDPIPVIGHLDDVILIPLGVALVTRLIPPYILAECRVKAEATQVRIRNWTAAVVVIVIWIFVVWGAVRFFAK